MRTHASDRVSFTICGREGGREEWRVANVFAACTGKKKIKSGRWQLTEKLLIEVSVMCTHLFENEVQHQRVVEAVLGIKHLREDRRVGRICVGKHLRALGSARERTHLLPEVEPPGNVGVGVVLLVGPLVQLRLDGLRLDGKLSRNCGGAEDLVAFPNRTRNESQ